MPSGELLVHFVRHVDPEAVDARALNAGNDLSDAARLQNHALASNAATSIGCGVANLHPYALAITLHATRPDP